MDSFEDASRVERQGIPVIERFLRQLDYVTDLVPARNGRLALDMQRGFGDAYVLTNKGKTYWFDYKVEQKARKNFFLETFSNRREDSSLEGREDRLGWLFTSKADRLAYYFLETKSLYIINMNALQDWAWRSQGRMYPYEEVLQQKYQQKNRTFGRLVPIAVIEKEVGFSHYCLESQDAHPLASHNLN